MSALTGMCLKSWPELAASPPSRHLMSHVPPPFPSSVACSPFAPSAPSCGGDLNPLALLSTPSSFLHPPAHPPRSSPGAADDPVIARSRGTLTPIKPLSTPFTLCDMEECVPGSLLREGLSNTHTHTLSCAHTHTHQGFGVKEVAILWCADRWLPLLIILSIIGSGAGPVGPAAEQGACQRCTRGGRVWRPDPCGVVWRTLSDEISQTETGSCHCKGSLLCFLLLSDQL